MPNNMITVVNSTGTMLVGTTNGTAGTGDAVGNFILNGGTWQHVSANCEAAIVAVPSAIPSTISGTQMALARTGSGEGYNTINVYVGFRQRGRERADN